MKNFILIVLLFTLGCQESSHSQSNNIPGIGDSGDKAAQTPGEQGEAPLTSDELFSMVNERVIQASCIRCHNSERPRAGIDLSTRELVDELIVAGDLEKSLLHEVIATGFMPPRGTPVSDENLLLLEEYILSLTAN
ncbi:MAG: hypothetical protein CL677_10775 [Bdellovibrionaceae bacterium]|nr:hypothetical protein [Pseudobdellovibrionaceae bacterium]|tara:strand:- start:24894 stop:25301 length:408 start_codon:yes stop_codon:yes gene_type:complete